MSGRALSRSVVRFNPIVLPSSSTPQYVNDEGFEYDPSIPTGGEGAGGSEEAGEAPLADEAADIDDGGEEDVELVVGEMQADEDVEMEDTDEIEIEEAEEEEEEAAPEPLLSVRDSLALQLSLIQTRQHHLTSLLPHVFTHPPIPSYAKLRARPPPKGTFLFPTPPPLVNPLPATEYHGPIRTTETASPGPSTVPSQAHTPDGQHVEHGDPSSSNSKRRSKPKKAVTGSDETEPPAHEIECISRCTLSVGPISFSGAEIWIGRFVEPRITVPKKERARPGERKERLKEERERREERDKKERMEKKERKEEEKTERRHSIASDGSVVQRTPRPRPSTDGASKRGGSTPKPRKSTTTATSTTTPAIRPSPTPPLHARPPGIRPPPGPPGLQSGPRPPRPPSAPSSRPTASPQLIQLVNQAASRAPWLSALIYKAAGSTANAEELERLGKAVARLSRGEPIEDLAPPGTVTGPASSSTLGVPGPGPSTVAQARPPASSSGTVGGPPATVPSVAQAVTPGAAPVPSGPTAPRSTAAPVQASSSANTSASTAVSGSATSGTSPQITPPVPPAPTAATASTSTQSPPSHETSASAQTTATTSALATPPANLETDVTTAAPSAEGNSPVTSASGSGAAHSTAVPPEAEDNESDDEVDMTGPKQVGGGPIPTEPQASISQPDRAEVADPPASSATGDSTVKPPPPTSVSDGLIDPRLAATQPLNQPALPAQPLQTPQAAAQTASGPPRPIVVPFAEPSVGVPHPLNHSPSMPPPPTIPSTYANRISQPTSGPSSFIPAHTSNISTVPASSSPLTRAPPPTPPPPPPPKPTYPLPPPFILIAFKEQPTEKYLIPLGQNSFISRIGGDFVTGPPPKPEPSPEPEPEPTTLSQAEPKPVISDAEVEASAKISAQAVPGAQSALGSISINVTKAMPEGTVAALPLRNVKPLRSRTRQSLGRGAKDQAPPPTPAATTATPPPVSPAVELAPAEALPEPPAKLRPISGLPPLPGTQPPPGTVLISTVVPSGESRWGRPDWERLAQRLPFENPEFWVEKVNTRTAQEEPKDDVRPTTPAQTATPTRARPSRKISNDANRAKATVNGEKLAPPVKPDVLNLSADYSVPLSGDLQPLTIRLLDVEDTAWKRIKDVAEEVEKAEIEAMFKQEPTLIVGIEGWEEDDSPTAPIQAIANASTQPSADPDTLGNDTSVDPSAGGDPGTSVQQDQTTVPASGKFQGPKRATLPERVFSALRPMYVSRKRARFASLLSRVPARAFLKTRLPPPPSQDLVEATTDKWAPRPYPISTKPLYVVDADGDGEDNAGNREIEFSPEPKNQRKRKANEKEETVTFELPVSLEALDERVEEGAKRGIGRRGRGGRMSLGRNAAAIAATSAGDTAEAGEDDGIKKKKYGKRGTEKGTCEGCARSGIKVWRKGPNGRGTLCNNCGDLYVAGRLGPLKAPGAMKTFLGDGDAAVDEGDGDDEEGTVSDLKDEHDDRNEDKDKNEDKNKNDADQEEKAVEGEGPPSEKVGNDPIPQSSDKARQGDETLQTGTTAPPASTVGGPAEEAGEVPAVSNAEESIVPPSTATENGDTAKEVVPIQSVEPEKVEGDVQETGEHAVGDPEMPLAIGGAEAPADTGVGIEAEADLDAMEVDGLMQQ
ncbi:hypothetical protein I317_07352 [Kwoniella heveanensis CBS 569]|nr:hypothetical protein I317_07352 [Kwoniella heveanensis CBS 569]